MKLHKIILTATIFSSTLMFCYSQSATLVNENELFIPADPETNRFSISKSEMNKIEFIKSELGDIIGYTISFKMGDAFYSKNMSDNSVPNKVKELIIQSGSGTVAYLEMKIKDVKTGNTLFPTYEYILTFD